MWLQFSRLNNTEDDTDDDTDDSNEEMEEEDLNDLPDSPDEQVIPEVYHLISILCHYMIWHLAKNLNIQS